MITYLLSSFNALFSPVTFFKIPPVHLTAEGVEEDSLAIHRNSIVSPEFRSVLPGAGALVAPAHLDDGAGGLAMFR